MKNKSITLKVRWSDYQKFKKIFPAERNEYVWHYFMRLRKHLENLEIERELRYLK